MHQQPGRSLIDRPRSAVKQASRAIRTRTLTAGDLATLLRLKEQAGWNQLPADLERYLYLEPEGCFLAEWNGAPVDYPRERTLPELFAAQVARTPNAVALVFDEQEVTYAELNARAEQRNGGNHVLELLEQLASLAAPREKRNPDDSFRLHL